MTDRYLITDQIKARAAASIPGLAAAVDGTAWELAVQREGVLREVARERLPRVLRWTVGRPSLLAALYRVHAAWRPTIAYGFDAGHGVACVQREDGSIVVLDTFRVLP